MYKNWSDADINFLLNNYKKYSAKELSVLLDRSEKSIFSKIHKLQLSKNSWTNEEDEILIDNYDNREINDYIHLLNNRSKSSVFNRAHVLKLRKNYKLKKYKYSINHNFFDNINNTNSYWSGFIAADGFINKDSGIITIKLSIKDLTHLEKLQRDIETNSPIKIIERKSFNNIHKYCYINLNSKKLKNDIDKNFNIKYKKTFNLKPPNIINYENKLSYICGIIDGDGFISVNKYDKIVIGVCGTLKLLKWIKKELQKIIDVSKISILKRKNIYYFNITGKKRCFILYQKISQLDLPLISRKWDIIKNKINTNGFE